MRDLYEISTLLTRFESVERTLPQVVDVAARALPVSTTVVIVEGREGPHARVWTTENVEQPRSDAALARAREAYAWFKGSANPAPEKHPPSVRRLPPFDVASAAAPALHPSFLLVPLLVQGGRVFGVLQVEGPNAFEEADVWFVNAAANQLAVAIERRAASDDGEARVRTQLDFTRALTGSLGEAVLATDTEARITFLNPAAEQLLGRTEASVLGEFAPDVLRVHGTDGSVLDRAQCPLSRALETQARVVSDDHSILGRGGIAVPVSCTAAPIRTAGELSGAVVVFRDVLEVKRAERAQRLLASASAALAESLDWRATLDALVRCTVPSFADLCFIDEVEEVGSLTPIPGDRTAQARAFATSRPVLIEHISDATIDELAHDPERRAHLRASGASSLLVVPLSVRGRAFGTLTFAMAESGRRYATVDVALAEELGRRAATAIDNARLHRSTQDALRDRQDILAMVSHDLRSPLSTVSMAATRLLREQTDRPDADRHVVELIARAAKRMQRMTSDLLDAASIEAGHLAVDAKPTAVSSILEDVLEATPQAADHSVQLVAAADPLLLVRCDRDRILQVLSNLLSNAIKFSPPGGRVDLSVEGGERFVRFTVADKGTGIAAGLLPHIFERYRQADDTASKGRGLGLFIVKGIVEAHGGSVGVETVPERGTTFFFDLPRALPSLASTARDRDDDPDALTLAR